MLANQKVPEDRLTAIAADLLRREVDEVAHSGGGGNSRIYRVRARDESYALKIYPLIEHDKRDRLGVEKQALQFFERHDIDCAPRWIGDCPGHALMTWVDGDLANPPTSEEVDFAIRFLADIRKLCGASEAKAMPHASEACLSGAEIIRQIENRLQRLTEISGSEPELARFLQQPFRESLEEAREAAQKKYAAADLSFDKPIASGACLIPADFGFHNALRGGDGSITFIDFEYFGWDDPAKLTADFLLHPGQNLNDARRQQIHAGLQDIFGNDPHFALRLNALGPLFALRWALILLNEFLPERWRGRAFARGENEWETAKNRQLKKAAEMLKNCAEGNLYA